MEVEEQTQARNTYLAMSSRLAQLMKLYTTKW